MLDRNKNGKGALDDEEAELLRCMQVCVCVCVCVCVTECV